VHISVYRSNIKEKMGWAVSSVVNNFIHIRS